jgi:glycosyltransferase involved in cell wall biosynthesis
MTTEPALDRDQPLVTIVLPSLNHGHFIRDAIDSVLAQDYPAIELILMDGGSTDDTPSVVAEYGSQVRFVSESDRGQADAINKGWRLGRGSILSWLCADDLLLPGAVSAVVKQFTQEPDVDLVYGDYEEWELPRDRLVVGEVGPPDVWKLTHHYMYFAQPTTFVRRSVLEAVGYLDEQLNWTMDWDLFIRVAWRGPMAYVPRPLARMRVYDQTKTRSGGRARFREIVRLVHKHTGRRYPPAYFYYAFETFQFSALRTLNRLVPAHTKLSGWSSRLIAALGARARNRTLAGLTRGWYPDGWASKVVDRVIWSNGSTLRIRGRLPEGLTPLDGQELIVEADGVRLASHRLPPGAFSIDVAIPTTHRRRSMEVRLRATRSFVPGGRGPSRDTRHLSYLLDELSIGES